MWERIAGTIPELRACWVGLVLGTPFFFALNICPPFALPLPAYLSVVPSLLHVAIQSSFFRVPLATPLALLPYLPLSHWYPARIHCPHSQNSFLPLMAFTPLSRLSCLFSFSGTYDLNNGKSRGKEKGDNRKRSSRKKRKTKKREFHLQIHSYTIQCLSSWEMDLCSLHLTLSQPSVHSSPRWREEMSIESGQFPKTRCGKVLFGIHEHNERHLLLLFYRN